MTEQENKNKERLMKAIDNLRDCVCGMNSSFMTYCCSESNTIFDWDEKKFEDFVGLLCSYAFKSACYHSEFDCMLQKFYSLTIKFIVAACNPNEHTFLSIRKIAKLLEKTPGYKCTYEYLIEAQETAIDEMFTDYWEMYDEFVKLLVGLEHEDFYETVRFSLQRFVEENSLTLFADTAAINSLSKRIDRVSVQYLGEFRRRTQLTGVDNDD